MRWRRTERPLDPHDLLGTARAAAATRGQHAPPLGAPRAPLRACAAQGEQHQQQREADDRSGAAHELTIGPPKLRAQRQQKRWWQRWRRRRRRQQRWRRQQW
eukprot:scaffold52054_cov59-Phaeocystis_antarctica.AAC.3